MRKFQTAEEVKVTDKQTLQTICIKI